MEAYRLKKSRGLDPLDFINKKKKGEDGEDGAAANGGGSGTGGYDYV